MRLPGTLLEIILAINPHAIAQHQCRALGFEKQGIYGVTSLRHTTQSHNWYRTDSTIVSDFSFVHFLSLPLNHPNNPATASIKDVLGLDNIRSLRLCRSCQREVLNFGDDLSNTS
jgi:hypothetical protein